MADIVLGCLGLAAVILVLADAIARRTVPQWRSDEMVGNYGEEEK